jgi:hypothetical protein
MTDLAPTPPDPLGRAGALAIAAGRVGIGIAAVTATRPTLRFLGLGTAEGTVVITRLAGIRDVALGLHAIAVRNDAEALGLAVKVAALADAGDAAAFAALARTRGLDRTVLMNTPPALYAALAGVWIAARLRSR